MTTSGQALSSERREGRPSPPKRGDSAAVACTLCKRRLSGEYYLTCVKCGASSCYIHISNHQRAQACGEKKMETQRSAGLGVEIPLLLARGPKSSVG
ncbi:MAG: hypothetical protein OK455_09545, partial [Thaumarchaeota archaeon]|nr:hypothetical protein [Nitrososphaerota archaeon]